MHSVTFCSAVRTFWSIMPICR